MGLLVYSVTATAGTNENIADITTPLGEIRTLLNGQLDAANLADNAVTTAKITAAAVTQAKLGLDVQSAQASSTLTLTTSEQDIAGATLTTTSAASKALVVATFDFTIPDPSTTAVICLGKLSVDGSVQTKVAVRDLTGSSSDPAGGGGRSDRATIVQWWLLTSVLAGKIIKLRAMKTNNVTTAQAVTGNTGLFYASLA